MYLLHFFTYTNKDRYIYYHCIRNNPYHSHYHCKGYEDPLTIPNPEIGTYIESIIFPIRKIYPHFYHPRIIQKELQERIQVNIKL